MENKLTFRKGDVIIVDEDFTNRDLDFKKSAKTWWGRNVSSKYNSIKNKDYQYEKDEILFIFNSDGEVEKNDKKLITGYTNIIDYDEFDEYPRLVIYHPWEFMPQTFSLSLSLGYTKVIRYDDLPKERREFIESRVKIKRLCNAINMADAYYSNMEIISIDNIDEKRYTISGFDRWDGKKLPDILFRYEKILTDKFTLGSDLVLNGDLFDDDMNEYN